MVHELRRSGFEPQWQRVETEPDFLAHLTSPPDVILADYSMPELDACRALRLLQDTLEASGAGLDIFPAKTEISVGAMDERPVPFHIFAQDDVSGLRDWRLRVTGGTDANVPRSEERRVGKECRSRWS